MMKWLMSFVLPGEAEVFARSLLQSILIRDDFPTLLLPMKAYSGLSGLGVFSTDGLDITYSACFIIMQQSNYKMMKRNNTSYFEFIVELFASAQECDASKA